MKFRISKAALETALRLVTSVVPQKSAIPAIRNVQLATSEKTLTLSGTNLDQSIRCRIGCADAEPGSILVNGELITGLVRECPDGTLVITAQDKHIAISHENGGAKLETFAADDFPFIEEDIGGMRIPLAGAPFQDLCAKAGFCAAPERRGGVLTGVHLAIEGNTFQATSTSGHIFARGQIPITNTAEIAASAIVPPIALALASKISSSGQELSEMVVSRHAVSLAFNQGETVLRSKVIDGTYPDTTALLPKQYRSSFIVETEPLISALRRTKLLSNTLNHGLTFLFSSTGVRLSTENSGVGSAWEDIPGILTGESLRIRFNNLFMLEVLSRIESRQTALNLNTAKDGCLIHPSVQEKTTVEYYILPVNLDA
jgi:DNA polymerase-3 subunit beta